MATTWPALFGSAVANLTGATLLKMPPCDPDSSTCQIETHPYPPELWAGNRAQLEKLRRRLTWAVNLAPQVESLRLRLGETLLAFKDRREAASFLPEADPTVSMYDYENVMTGVSARGPRLMSLMSRGPFENYLIAGYQQSAAGNWQTAVQAFRLALAHGAAEMQPTDHQAYLTALAYYYAQQAQIQETAPLAYLAGKYFARIGDWTTAETWLEKAKRSTGRDEFGPQERARTWTYLGLVREQTGNMADARIAYETAIDLAPKLREAQARLLLLLEKMSDQSAADRVRDDLAALGPKYLLGQFGAGLNAPEPAKLSNGWVLVGYDLDEESLEAGGPLDIWLWWQLPAGQVPSGDSWLHVGNYWLQRQGLVNLAPNPGFEWGMDSNELPLGYISRYGSSGPSYANPSGVASIVHMGDVSNANQLLQLDKAGIKSPFIQVESGAMYLTAGWLKRGTDSGGRVILGRQCFPTQPSIHEFFYRPWQNDLAIGDLTPNGTASGEWVHVAHLGRIENALSCQVYLEQVGGLAEFDRLLFVKLPAWWYLEDSTDGRE